MRFDPKLVLVSCVCALGLSGCVVTEEPTTRRVETWGSETRWDENGNAVTTETHSVGQKKIERIPEQDLVGFWILADNADRECLVELRISQSSGASVRSAVPTRECVNGMRNVAGWALADGQIVLFDKNTRQIGKFEAATTYRYQGEFTITTGVTYPATFVRGA